MILHMRGTLPYLKEHNRISGKRNLPYGRADGLPLLLQIRGIACGESAQASVFTGIFLGEIKVLLKS